MTMITKLQDFIINENFNFIGLNIKPEDYTRLANISVFRFHDQDGEPDSEMDIDIDDSATDEQVKIIENLAQSLMQGSEPRSCNICNHRITRGMVIKDKENRLYLIGFDCGNNVMKFKFDIVNAKKQTLKHRKEQDKLNRINTILLNNPGLDDALTKNNKIINNIATNFFKWGNLTDKQIAFVFKLAGERVDYEQKSQTVKEGKVVDEFEILSVKMSSYEAAKSRYSVGTQYTHEITILLQHKDGWKLWGKFSKDVSDDFNHWKMDYFKKEFLKTNPSLPDNSYSFLKFLEKEIDNILPKGTKVILGATIEKSAKDPFFGVFKRLTEFKIVS